MKKILILLIISIFAVQIASADVIEVIDPSANSFGSSIKLDSSGYADLSYSSYDGVNCILKHAYNDGGSWTYDTVDSDVLTSGATSIDTDSSGYPHISYNSYIDCSSILDYPDFVFTQDLKYAFKNVSGWHIETVDSAGNVGSHSNIVIDNNSGYPHISYNDNTNNYTKYAYKDAGGWNYENVDYVYKSPGFTSIDLDSSGYPHISYSNQSPGCSIGNELKYAYKDVSGWNYETVDSDHCTGWYNSMVLDSSGNVHIAYGSGGGLGLRYAFRNASTSIWTLTTLDSSAGNSIHDIFIKVDSNNYPRISYKDGLNDDLKYAYKDGSGWHINTVDSAGAVGGYTSIDIDDNDKSHITYGDSTDPLNNNIKYARISCSNEICDSVDNDCDVTVDEEFDQDSDGYTSCSGDRNDNNININPGATEVCDNAIDDDCDGFTDCADSDCNANQSCLSGPGSCTNLDGDGYSQEGDVTGSCCGKSGNKVCGFGADCDDNNRWANPGESESCSTPYDDDCVGGVNDGCDLDGDGSASPTDCNDNDNTIYPGQTETCNNVDDDCDGNIDEVGGCTDSDGDNIIETIDICPSDPDNDCNVDKDQEYLTTTSTSTLSTGNGETTLEVESGDLASNSVITVEKDPSVQPNFVIATRAKKNAKALYSYLISPEGTSLADAMTLTMYWNDNNSDGQEDSTGMDETLFDIFWYNPDTAKWEEQDSTCDLVNNYCTLDITHFSQYAIAEGGDSALFIWDDSEGTTHPCDSKIEVWANYTNYTSDAFITGAECNLSFSDAPSTIYSMIEAGDGSTVFYYNNSKSYDVAGTYNFTVTCAHPDYSTVTATDNITLYEQCQLGPGGPIIPEFSATTMILTIIIVGLGVVLIAAKKRKV